MPPHVGGCINVRGLENGIVLHTIPFYGDERLKKEKMDIFCKTETCWMGLIPCWMGPIEELGLYMLKTF